MYVVARINPSAQTQTALVVDPSAALGLAVARGLRRYGYAVEVTTSLQHASVRRRRGDISLVIIHDVGILSLADVHDLGRCVVIGGLDSELRDLVRRGVAFVGKPLELDELLRAVRTLLPQEEQPSSERHAGHRCAPRIRPREEPSTLQEFVALPRMPSLWMEPSSHPIDSSQASLATGCFESEDTCIAPQSRRVYTVPAMGYSVQNRDRKTLRIPGVQ